MFGRNYHLIAIVFFSVLSGINISCQGNTPSARENIKRSDSANEKIKRVLHKPPSTTQDTLKISTAAAVFYSPDSLQLEKIKEQTDHRIFSGSEHEYFYMMRNARMVIKKTWPNLKIVECTHDRYILFIKKDSSKEYIDLNKYDDRYGLFIFDGKKSPMPVDAMNIETQASFYLKP